MYRIKYINFNLLPFFVRDLCGGETYLLNNHHTWSLVLAENTTRGRRYLLKHLVLDGKVYSNFCTWATRYYAICSLKTPY